MRFGASGSPQGQLATSSGVDKLTVELGGLKEIEQMFKQLPKQINKTRIWGRFWKKNSAPLVEAAKAQAPTADRDIPYPPAYKKWKKSNPRKGKKYKGMMIEKGTLKESIIFYRTRAAKEANGGYVGPRVKGKYKQNKGGYFGAWVEYGHKLRHKNTKGDPFMQRAWRQKSQSVLSSGFKDAEDIFVKAVKTHEKRLKKFGSWGY
tara:strand:- start:371 stop:985 length:615 start_codon:yes stop_codon:yes gene_type:complete